MTDRSASPQVWQYAIVWTPGEAHSAFQLWATTRQGVRTLWDSWEGPGFKGTPTLATVLYWLYSASIDAQERHSHLG